MRKTNLLFVLWFFVFDWGTVTYAQWVTHHNPVFQPDILKPTVGVPITDPRFGTTLTRISNARASGYAGIVPQYSKRQAWNANESLMLLFTGDGRTLLCDGRTYQFKKALDGVEGEDIFWHPTNPSLILYSPDSILYSYNVDTDERTALHAFTDYTWANTRGEGNLSRDGRYYALAGQIYNYATGEVKFKDFLVFDILANNVIAKLALPETLSDFDWVSISPLGNYVVVDYATTNSGRFEGIEVYDRQLNFIWQNPLGAGHSDLAVDAAGDEVLVIHYYDSGTNSNFIKKFRLSDGKETSLLEFSWQFDSHISCRNEARSEWCFVSTYDGEARLMDDSLSWLPFEDEIFALKLDGSGEVQRIAHHHSRRFSPTTPDRDHSVYWAEPHATVSRDGGRILFGSNWREHVESDSSVDAYVVDFRSMVGVREHDHLVPAEIRLEQNYPNPFNPVTTISFSVKEQCHVLLRVYDVLGREVITLVDSKHAPGFYRVNFDAGNLASGVYFYRIRMKEFQAVRKMVVLE